MEDVLNDFPNIDGYINSLYRENLKGVLCLQVYTCLEIVLVGKEDNEDPEKNNVNKTVFHHIFLVQISQGKILS